jgi:hypothetical protein
MWATIPLAFEFSLVAIFKFGPLISLKVLDKNVVIISVLVPGPRGPVDVASSHTLQSHDSSHDS